MKKFNIKGTCVQEENYMIDVTDRVEQIKKLVDKGFYLTAEKSPKSGKTTLLAALERTLVDCGYIVISINFGQLDADCFKWESVFCVGFIKQAVSALRYAVCDNDYIQRWANYRIPDIDSLGRHIIEMCRDRKVVLIADDVDKHGGNQIFLRFQQMLRAMHIAREKTGEAIFHSVILAGVSGVKKIMIPANSPALLAKTYDVLRDVTGDLRVNTQASANEIAVMLGEYKDDYGVNMDITVISQEIYDYTNGQPYLVSKLCKCIYEELEQDWTINGIHTAVKLLLGEKGGMLAELIKHVENDAYLYELIYDVLITGEYRKYEVDVDFICKGEKIGLIKRSESDIIRDIMPDMNVTTNSICITNRIYEMLFCNYFISQTDKNESDHILREFSNINSGRRFNMELCMQRFAEYYAAVSAGRTTEYLERNSRLIFLAYLKGYMSIYGFCYTDGKNTNMCRMDITAEIGGEKYIIKLHTRRFESQSEDEAYQQFSDYLESRDKDKGYLVVFDFLHGTDTDSATKYIDIDGKRIFEVVV